MNNAFQNANQVVYDNSSVNWNNYEGKRTFNRKKIFGNKNNKQLHNNNISYVTFQQCIQKLKQID